MISSWTSEWTQPSSSLLLIFVQVRAARQKVFTEIYAAFRRLRSDERREIVGEVQRYSLRLQ
jgi:hypothetical protein